MRVQEIDQQGSQMALQFVEMPTRPRERHQAAKKARKKFTTTASFLDWIKRVYERDLGE